MPEKVRLLVDISSILKACYYAGKDQDGYAVEFEGSKCWVNTAEYAFETFVVTYLAALRETGTNPFQTILVKDGHDSRQLRRMLWPAYKAKRKGMPPEMLEEYGTLLAGVEDEILSMGGTVVYQDGMEADDVIAHLVGKLRGKKIIWSRDGDMLALRNESTDVYLKDTLNPEIYKDCPAEYVTVYKALVGDSSDNLPGAKGFGPKAFTDFALRYGFEGLADMRDMLNERALGELEDLASEFGPFQKILDNKENVYASFACAKFYPHKINTLRDELRIKTGYVKTWEEGNHPMLQQFFAQQLLVSADNYVSVMAALPVDLAASPLVALDIETSEPPESQAWKEKIASLSKSKKPEDIVDVFGSMLTGLSITYGPNLQYSVYFSVDHAETRNCTSHEVNRAIQCIPEKTPIAVHNSAFELPVLFLHWGRWLPHVWDTLLMKSYADENTALGLKDCSKQYFGYTQATYEEVTQGKKMNELPAEGAVFAYACDDTRMTAPLYNRLLLTLELEETLDVFVACELPAQYWVAENFVQGLEIDLDALRKAEQEDDEIWATNWKILRDYLFKKGWPGTVWQSVPLSSTGIKEGFQLATGKKFTCRCRLVDKVAEAWIAQGGPEDLAEAIRTDNPDLWNEGLLQFWSPDPSFSLDKKAHVRALLYDTMKLPVRLRAPATDNMRAKGQWEGTPSADADAIEHACALDLMEGSEEATVLKALRAMTRVSTRRKFYYRPYPALMHWKDGRVHPQLGQSRAGTRRFTPYAPNINQLPKKGEGKKVRAMIKAPPGYVILSYDFKGQELELAAERSGDVNLRSCYLGGSKRSPHILTAVGIAEKQQRSELSEYDLFSKAKDAEDPVAAKLYAKAKSVNFSSQYLCRAPKLARLLIVTPEEAQQFLDAKAAVYPGLTKWQQDTIGQAYIDGFAKTMLGARRHLREQLKDQNRFVRLKAERQAVNYEIQGSGGEMLKLAINKQWLGDSDKYWVPKGILSQYSAWLLFPVHDEADFIVPIEHAVECGLALHACMVQKYADMELPLESEMSIGFDFAHLLEIGASPTPAKILDRLKELQYGDDSGICGLCAEGDSQGGPGGYPLSIEDLEEDTYEALDTGSD